MMETIDPGSCTMVAAGFVERIWFPWLVKSDTTAARPGRDLSFVKMRISPWLVTGGILGLLALLATRAWAGAQKSPLHTVADVDLARYMGDWRVIAEIPYFAESNCVDSVESYALRADGTIDNWFSARKKSFDAPVKRVATARAVVLNKQTNAEWKVKFAGGLLAAKYLIIDLDPNYQWAVIGHPSRKYGWILAREKSLPKPTYDGILQRLKANGYDTSKFLTVPQFPAQLKLPNAAIRS